MLQWWNLGVVVYSGLQCQKVNGSFQSVHLYPWVLKKMICMVLMVVLLYFSCSLSSFFIIWVISHLDWTSNFLILISAVFHVLFCCALRNFFNSSGRFCYKILYFATTSSITQKFLFSEYYFLNSIPVLVSWLPFLWMMMFWNFSLLAKPLFLWTCLFLFWVLSC